LLLEYGNSIFRNSEPYKVTVGHILNTKQVMDSLGNDFKIDSDVYGSIKKDWANIFVIIHGKHLTLNADYYLVRSPSDGWKITNYSHSWTEVDGKDD